MRGARLGQALFVFDVDEEQLDRVCAQRRANAFAEKAVTAQNQYGMHQEPQRRMVSRSRASSTAKSWRSSGGAAPCDNRVRCVSMKALIVGIGFRGQLPKRGA